MLPRIELAPLCPRPGPCSLPTWFRSPQERGGTPLPGWESGKLDPFAQILFPAAFRGYRVCSGAGWLASPPSPGFSGWAMGLGWRP